MLTSYLVHCPHHGCDWFGSLLPQDRPDAWLGYAPSIKVVSFQCPQCQRDFAGRVVGDDVVPLSDEQMVAPLA